MLSRSEWQKADGSIEYPPYMTCGPAFIWQSVTGSLVTPSAAAGTSSYREGVIEQDDTGCRSNTGDAPSLIGPGNLPRIGRQ